MKRTALVALVAAITACSPDTLTAPSKTLEAPTTAAFGFDELGYNDIANIFNGSADGTDGVLDGKVWGDPTYANDHLVMKWNKAWENCNAARDAGATQAELATVCAGAWTLNEWNGQVTGGSGETWHYKFLYVGPCGSYGTPLSGGGYCIWNEYAVLMSHGNAEGHFWDAHAKPNGFGN